MITLNDLKTEYVKAVILQYRNKPRAKASIEALTAEFWLDGLALAEASCFDLDTAIGAQLDVIGRIVGVNRNVFGLDLSHTFFEMTAYSGTPAGVTMQRYADSPDGPEIMLRYHSDATYAMSDFEFRALIKLKIIYNTCKRTTRALITALYSVFGTSVALVDNLDMTMTFSIKQPYYNVFIVAGYLGIVPKPMGVAYTLSYI